MATIQLSDGRVIPVVTPHLGDQMNLERQMKAMNPKYGPREFQEDMKLGTFQSAFRIFATFNRAGIQTTIQEVLELDLQQLSEQLQQEPGDMPADAESDDAQEVEGEQTPDPQPAQTGGDVSEPRPPTESGLSATA